MHLISDSVNFTKPHYKVNENELLQVILNLDKPYTTNISVYVQIILPENKFADQSGELYLYSVH